MHSLVKLKLMKRKILLSDAIFRNAFMFADSEKEFKDIFITSQEELAKWLKEKNQVI